MGDGAPRLLTPQSSPVAPVVPVQHKACRVQVWFRRTRQYLPSWRSHAWDRWQGWPESTMTGQRSAPDRSVWYALEISLFALPFHTTQYHLLCEKEYHGWR